MLYNLVKNVNTFIDEMKSIGDDKVGENEWFELKFNEDLDHRERGNGSDECDSDIEWIICFYYLLIILYWHGLVIYVKKWKWKHHILSLFLSLLS